MKVLNEMPLEALMNLYKDTGITLIIHDGIIVDVNFYD